jgi:hypothetical protein
MLQLLCTMVHGSRGARGHTMAIYFHTFWTKNTASFLATTNAEPIDFRLQESWRPPFHSLCLLPLTYEKPQRSSFSAPKFQTRVRTSLVMHFHWSGPSCHWSIGRLGCSDSLSFQCFVFVFLGGWSNYCGC